MKKFLSVLALIVLSCVSVFAQDGTCQPAEHRTNLGMFVARAPNFNSYLQTLVAYEQALGLPVGNLDVLIFNAWGDGDKGFPTDVIAKAAAQGRTVILTSEPWKRDFANLTVVQPEFTLQSIADGLHDVYLREWATQAANLGIPFIYRFAQEMSTKPGTKEWYPWQGEPQEYKAAYRHIVEIFREQGATNIRFMWSAMKFDEGLASKYYPGDDVVDIIGTTILNHGTANNDYPVWLTIPDLFSHSLAPISRLWPGKPIYIAEFGTAEQGGSKAEWLREGFKRIATNYPQVEGVMLLDGVDFKHDQVNWSIDSSFESLVAMIEVANCYINR